MYMCVLVCAVCTRVQTPSEARCVRPSAAGVKGGREPLRRCWELDSGPLEGQCALLAAELALKLHIEVLEYE